jgi:hypothetical protein
MKRRALLCLALPASVLAARGAAAFREQAATEAVAQSWADRCRGFGPAAGGPVALCPFCGCPVLGARDHGEAGPLPPG